ncbi:MAG: peptidyl-prolyl cis-trans isomerase [Candidatus Hydrogenedentes bacterium]|nr:peptidyl-prolyl cis-trans isomerase [Candidatus Hydrogenedentota bacterium]
MLGRDWKNVAESIVRVLKDPFVQFLIVGALIFAAYSLLRPGESGSGDRRILIDSPMQTWLYENFSKQFGRPPSRDEMERLIGAYAEHEVKYREALAMGLDDRDTIVRRRMMQKFDFLFGNAAADAVPDDATLQEFLAGHAEEFALSPAISFEHLWFSPDERGSAAEQDARAALAALQSGESAEGDLFPFDVTFELATSVEVRNVLGVDFAEAVFDAPLGIWFGPVASGLGVHLVRVAERRDSELPAFVEVREAVLQRWREVESDRLLAERIAALKAEYEVEIDQSALDGFTYSGAAR